MKTSIDETYCKGCSLCIAVCKPNALDEGTQRNAGGYIVPAYNGDKCILCGNCEWTCPEMCITVDMSARKKRKEHA